MVKVDITAQSRSVVCSPHENIGTQSAIYGEIGRYHLFENQAVHKGDTLVALNTERIHEQITLLYQKKSDNTRLALENQELSSNIIQAQKELRQYVIVAPAEGTLVQVAAYQQGDFITSGQTLGYISSRDSLLAECYVSPLDIGYMRLGQLLFDKIDN